MSKSLAAIAFIMLLSMTPVITQAVSPSPEQLECINALEPMFLSNCASDYAVATTTAVEYALCMKDRTKLKGIKISAQDIICNCTTCHTVPGNGCMGGKYKEALTYLKTKALGGSYINAPLVTQAFAVAPAPLSNYSDCLAYFRPVCDPDVEDKCDIAPYNPKLATNCPTTCNRKTGAILIDTVRMNGIVGTTETKKTPADYTLSLGQGRPLISTMEIFEDMEFFLGTDNVYVHSAGQSLGVVNVVIVSTGEAGGVPFWVVLVPWDKKYDTGNKIKFNTIKIVKGVNHCNIENEATEVVVVV